MQWPHPGANGVLQTAIYTPSQRPTKPYSRQVYELLPQLLFLDRPAIFQRDLAGGPSPIPLFTTEKWL
jgi:hypothetical protein